jgi:hypothetical protein
MAGQRDDHRCAQPWHPRREATRRDPLLRLEFADWCQSPAQSHPAALVDREQLALGAGRAAGGRRPPLPGGNGVQILGTLRSLAINALRLEGIWSITEGIAALAHDIAGLLRLLGWRATAGTPSG